VSHVLEAAACGDVQWAALLRARAVVHVRARLLQQHARHAESVGGGAHVQAGPAARHVQVGAGALQPLGALGGETMREAVRVRVGEGDSVGETVRETQWERHGERDHVEGETVRETQWERRRG
jgi:hypothetical protein